MVAEQRVSVYIISTGRKLKEIFFNGFLSGKTNERIQVTCLWQWASRDESGNVETVETEQLVQPLLHRVCRSVPDGLVQGNLVEAACCEGRKTGSGDGLEAEPA